MLAQHARVGVRPAPSGETFDVLALDASTRQTLALVRSLGAAGLRVAAAECFVDCSPDLPILAFRSRFVRASLVLPSFADEPAAYAEGVLRFVREHPTRVVIPASDGSIAALLPYRDELERCGTRLAVAPSEVAAVANDKCRTLAVAKRLGISGPPTVHVDRLEDVATLGATLGYPLVLKPSTSWSDRTSVRLQATEVVDEVEAEQVVRRFLDAGVTALAQAFLPGAREGITLMMVDGEVHAAFAHFEVRTSPALGGASVVRTSIPLPEDLYAQSVRLVRELGLDGVSGVEYRRDAAGRPYLMEVNARVSGTLEHAAACGVDFPRLLWQWTTGQTVGRVLSSRIGVRLRWLRGDMRWLRDNHRRRNRPEALSSSRAAARFAAEFLRSSRYDCLAGNDFGPFVAELRTTVASVVGSRPTPARAA